MVPVFWATVPMKQFHTRKAIFMFMLAAKMIVLLLCLGLAMLAQENRHTSNVPMQPHGRVTQMITPSRMPHSIEDLVQTSDLVIDGYVEAIEKARIRNP